MKTTEIFSNCVIHLSIIIIVIIIIIIIIIIIYVCGSMFTVDHTMTCQRRGLVIQRRNEIRDLQARAPRHGLLQCSS